MWHAITRSLRHSNYRRYFSGQLVSLIGSQMAQAAQAWLVWRLTESAFWLGLTQFAMLLPILLFGLYGGSLADRFPRRSLMVVTQSLMLVHALALTLLTLSGHIEAIHVVGLAVFFGLLNAVDMPVRQAFLSELVPRAELANAVGLNSSMFNFSRFVGPAIAGVVIVAVGEGSVFAVNTLTYVAVLLALWSLNLPKAEQRARPHSRIREGLFYVWEKPLLRRMLLHVGAISLMGSSFVVLMPLFAAERFGGDADLMGWLLGAAGLGSLLGALNLARHQQDVDLSLWVQRFGRMGAIALLGFAALPQLWTALALLVLTGFSVTTVIASTHAYFQVRVDDAYRGRVMALFSVMFVGLMPLGGMLAGTLAEYWHATWTVVSFAVMGLGVSLWYSYARSRAMAR